MRTDGRNRPAGSSRGLSPVVGTTLMVAIVVMVAAVVATLVIGFEERLQEPAPSGGFDHEYVPTGEDNTADRPYVTITHQVGETIDAENVVIRDESGNSITWADVWTGGPEVKAREYVHVDGFGSDAVIDPVCEAGQTYTVVLQDDDGDSLIVDEWTAPSDPQFPDGSPSDGDGDGVPDWC